MSNLTFKANICDYNSAMGFLNGRVNRKLAHNTEVVNYSGFRAHILYHGNIIATFYRQELGLYTEYLLELPPVVTLRTAGWDTVTTARRLHMILNAVQDRYPNHGSHYGIGILKGEVEWRYWWTDLDDKVGRIHRPFGSAALAVFSSGHVRPVVDHRLTVNPTVT